MKSIPRILITPGEPAGIGPDIVLRIAEQSWPAEIVVIGDPGFMMARAQQLKLAIEFIDANLHQPAEYHQPSQLKIIPVTLAAPCYPSQLNPQNARFVINTLERASRYCLEKKADALVTGPVQKSVINDAGIAFTGHTEWLAAQCKVEQVLMLFVANQLKVALATTHLPLAEVPHAITKDGLIKTIRLLHREGGRRFGLVNPHIVVCGLNPHAGESGYLGREEIEIITPALDLLRQEHFNLTGPLPADTVFTEKYLSTADVILAMYHDQALPVVKYIGFNHAVNVTLGLPFIRTSVDHGTALELAASGLADAGSMAAAIHLAIDLAENNGES